MRLTPGSGGGIAVTCLVAVALLLPACEGVVFNAPEITVLVRSDRIVYAGAGDEQRLVGGETVLRIENDTAEHRQIVLAKLGDERAIPREILEAESPREDNRILGMTHELEPREAAFEQGGFGYDTDGSSFHIYLAPGERYVLFDRLRGLGDGVALEFVPGAADS